MFSRLSRLRLLSVFLTLVLAATALGGSVSARPAAVHAQPPNIPINLYGVACWANITCYAVGGEVLGPDRESGDLLYTTDAVSPSPTWSQYNGSPSLRLPSPLRGVACWTGSSATSPTCLAVGGTGEAVLIKNGDATGGATVENVHPPSVFQDQLNAVTCPSPSTCYAVGDQGDIQKTTDAGSTWDDQKGNVTWGDQRPLPRLISVACPDSSDTCFAVGKIALSGFDGDILRTTNAGSTWDFFPQPHIGARSYLGAVACPSPSTCYVVGGGSIVASTPAILKTSNGGNTWDDQTGNINWEEQTSTPNLWDVSCQDTNACFAVGEGGTILATTDGGATWDSQTDNVNWFNQNSTPPVLTGVACMSAGSGVCLAVGYATSDGYVTILRTTDLGKTWSEVCRSGCPDPEDLQRRQHLGRPDGQHQLGRPDQHR